jgi:hypothetical protein
MSAQNDPQDEVGGWFILSSNSKVSDRFSVQFQTQFRFYELASELQQLNIRSGVTFRVMPGLSLGAGYAYFRNDFSYLSKVPESFDEHRIVEDIMLDHKIGKAKVVHRARLENRFISIEGETNLRHWFRHLAKFVYPVGDNFSFDIYNEIFLNFDETPFSQDWMGIGATYVFNQLVKTRVGFQRILLEGPNFNRILLELSFTPDFSKKETAKP